MWLENLEVRIKKYPRGYVVETLKVKYLFGIFKVEYWIHIESFSGMKDSPYYYKSKEVAANQAALHFKWELLIRK